MQKRNVYMQKNYGGGSVDDLASAVSNEYDDIVHLSGTDLFRRGFLMY